MKNRGEVIRFGRTISKAEVKSTYLNLTDEFGQPRGADFGLRHRDKLIVIDGEARRTRAQMHHENQIWGSLKHWYVENSIQAGDRISVEFDPELIEDGLHVLRLTPGSSRSPARAPEPEKAANRRSGISIIFENRDDLIDILKRRPQIIQPGLEPISFEKLNSGKKYPDRLLPPDLLCRRPDGGYLVIAVQQDERSEDVIGKITAQMGWLTREMAGNESVSGLILAQAQDDILKYSTGINPSLSYGIVEVNVRITIVD